MATATTAQAADKQFPITAIMARLGRAPLVEAAGGNVYYLSPFREEQTPSFVVQVHRNIWSDFGETPAPGQKVAGGDVLSLVMKLTGFPLPVARLALRSWAGEQPTELPLPATGRTISSGKLTFHDVRTEPLTWDSLIQYLTNRRVNWELVRRNVQTTNRLQQIFYRIPGSNYGKPYFALGWKTGAGWEVRNARFQGTIGGKGLTWLPGQAPGIAVFEGFMDYLSALTHFGRSSLSYTVLILNSVALLGEAYPRLLESKETIHWFGDNDAAGLRALHELRQVVGTQRVKAHNEIYRGYKDFNDFLTKTLPGKPLPAAGAFASQLSKKANWWLWVVFTDRAPGTREAAGKKRKCTFYCWSNEAEGLERLRVLRNQLGEQMGYYRLCERTEGRKFRILEWAGFYQPLPERPGYVPPVFDESE